MGWHREFERAVRRLFLEPDVACLSGEEPPNRRGVTHGSPVRTTGWAPCSYGDFDHFRLLGELGVVLDGFEVEVDGLRGCS